MYAATCEQLRLEATRLGVVLQPERWKLFERYLDLLLVWNKRINLTSVRTPDGVARKHFLDSLAVATFLPTEGDLIDVGSGAGLPGIPLAIALPGLSVTLLESNGKKSAFLRRAVQALELTCEVVQMRLDAFVERGRRFDIAISRAVLSPAEWVAAAAPLIREGGRIIVMTGRDEPPPPPPSCTLERVFAYRIPPGEQRHLGLYVPRGTVP